MKFLYMINHDLMGKSGAIYFKAYGINQVYYGKGIKSRFLSRERETTLKIFIARFFYLPGCLPASPVTYLLVVSWRKYY